MGLDQYAYATYKKVKIKQVLGVIVEKHKTNKREDFFQWRKHPSLQGWMETLYYKKGGKKPVFNCEPVELREEDLNVLEHDIKNKALPQTEGFFFGKDEHNEEEMKEDLEFVKKARAYLNKGHQVFYTSWW